MSDAAGLAMRRAFGLRLLRGAGDVLVAPGRAFAALLAIAWGAGIWWLSSTSLPPGEPHFGWSLVGNLAHAPLFGLLALWLLPVLPRGAAVGRRPWPTLGTGQSVLVLFLVGAYGCLDEWHQSWTTGRDATVFDVVTDLVGAGGVLLVARYIAGRAAHESGLRLRLLAAALACGLAATLATVTS